MTSNAPKTIQAFFLKKRSRVRFFLGEKLVFLFSFGDGLGEFAHEFNGDSVGA